MNTTCHLPRISPSESIDAIPRRTPRPNGRASLAAAVGLALTAGAPLAYAGPPAPGAALGNEFQVNTRTAGSQSSSAVARDAAGDFVVVWQGNDADSSGILAQRYRADGAPLGGEFQVNTHTTGNQIRPVVAMDAAGDFVVAWSSSDGDGFGIFTRRYDKAGKALDSSDIPVNTHTVGPQRNAVIAMDAAGDFVAAWMDESGADGDGYGIFERRYRADGTARDSSDIPVNTHISGGQGRPAVAMDAAGDFVVAWVDYSGADGDGYGIFARRYQADGTALDSSDVPINTHTSGDQDKPAIAMDATGDFVVAWEDWSGADGDVRGVFARRYDNTGKALDTSDIQVNRHISGVQEKPAVALNAAGDFVVAWTDDSGADGDGGGSVSGGIFARRYDNTGKPLDSSDVQINTHTSGLQADERVAMDAAGDFVVTWLDGSGADGYGLGIFAQRYLRESSLDLKSVLALAPADTVAPGGDITLTAGIDNNEPPFTLTDNATVGAAVTNASGLTATLTLPDGVTFGKATGTNWTCPAAPTGNVLTCTYSVALAAASATENLVVNLTAPVTAGTQLAFSNAVFGGQPDAAADNNTAMTGVTVKTPVDDTGGDGSGDNDTDDDGSGNSGSGGGTGDGLPPPASSSSGGGGALGWLALFALALPSLGRRWHD